MAVRQMGQMRAGLLFLAAVGPAVASSLEEGVDTWHRGDHQAAVEIWMPLARLGDPQAGLYLAFAYRNGLGIDRDYGQAAHGYLSSAQACPAELSAGGRLGDR